MLHRFAVFALLVLGACARSHVTPVPAAAIQSGPGATAANPAPAPTRICIIENPRVRSDFLDAYKAALSSRGYEVEVVKETPQVSQCPLTTRYVAYWAWDMVLYMRQAELRVYRDGKPAGRAVFQARSSRFIDTEAKVKELVDQLLPQSR